MERDDFCHALPPPNVNDFNSHAHVERDELQGEIMQDITISTHTLTWSVTEKFPTINTIFDISTHTLTWSVTTAN